MPVYALAAWFGWFGGSGGSGRSSRSAPVISSSRLLAGFKRFEPASLRSITRAAHVNAKPLHFQPIRIDHWPQSKLVVGLLLLLVVVVVVVVGAVAVEFDALVVGR